MQISMRRSSGAALALTGLLALGACGSSGDKADSDTGSSQDQKGTDDSGNSSAKGDTVDAGELAERTAAAMKKAGSGTMTMDTDGDKATGDFAYVDGKVQQHTTVPNEGGVLEILAVGDFVYVKGLPDQKKPWAKIDPKGTDPVSQMFKGVVEGTVNDPTRMASKFKGTTATVKSKDGDATTYEFTVDSAKALQGAATPTPSASASVPPLQMTYVLDTQYRPVSISTTVGSQSLTVTYKDWGKKVDIAAPPADQVAPIALPSGN